MVEGHHQVGQLVFLHVENTHVGYPVLVASPIVYQWFGEWFQYMKSNERKHVG